MEWHSPLPLSTEYFFLCKRECSVAISQRQYSSFTKKKKKSNKKASHSLFLSCKNEIKKFLFETSVVPCTCIVQLYTSKAVVTAFLILSKGKV